MKNNKGFSLVELIIVIAIMAVLVGVLAPTYLQYVEKSKKSNDVSTVDSIVNAIEISAIDPTVQTAGSWAITITVSSTGTSYAADATVTGAGAHDGDTAMMNALKAIVPETTKLKSAKWGEEAKTATGASTAPANQFVIKAVPDGEYGAVTIKMVTGTDANAGFHAYTKHDKISKS